MHKLQILISASAFVSTHPIHLLYTSKKEEKRTEIQTFQQKSGFSFGGFNKK